MTTIFLNIGAFVLFVTFGTGLWCISHLKNYIDEEKIRQEPSIAEALRESLPPARILTEQGKRIRKIGFVSFTFALCLFLVMFIGRFLYPL